MRMQLTDEEAKIILRMREHEAQHRKGWNASLEAAAIHFDEEAKRHDLFAVANIAAHLRNMKKDV